MKHLTVLSLLGSALATPAVIALSETPSAIAGDQPVAVHAVSSLERAPQEPSEASQRHAVPSSHLRWRRESITVDIDASVDRLGPLARKAVENAFTPWLESVEGLPRIEFGATRGASPAPRPDGKNTVLLAPITLPGHERELGITLVYSDAKTGDILETDIVLNSAFAFRVVADDTPSSSCHGVYDVQNVMTHEVGHFFGLGEDTEHAHSTMYLWTASCEVHKRALNYEDAALLGNLYSGSREQASVGRDDRSGLLARADAPGTPRNAMR